MAKTADKQGGRIRLGIGGEYQPQSLLLDQHDARRRFFWILTQRWPEIFTDLRAVHAIVQDEPKLWHSPNVPVGLARWGMRYNLRDLWCWDLAREAFAEWDKERKGAELTVSDKTHSLGSAILGLAAYPGIVLGTRKINLDTDGDPIPGEAFIGVGPLSVSVHGWPIFNEGESAFRKRAVEHFKQELEGYIERAKAAAKDHGAVSTIIKGAEFEKHLTWLARAAVMGERPTDIWKSLGPRAAWAGKKTKDTRGGLTRRAVEKAIRDTAALIGLTLPQKSISRAKNMRT